ncbi:MAG TPA: hypothetical protein VM555_11220 [Tahibacter sp.]|nr:hypothetical protein [Tahibacter sp.]
MARKTTNTRKPEASKTEAGKTAASRTTRRKSKVAASTTAAMKRSSEIVPKRAPLARAAQQLKSPKVFVPLAVALGIGVAAVRKIAGVAAARGPRALPRMAREISPRFSEAVHALAELGRELRAKLR